MIAQMRPKIRIPDRILRQLPGLARSIERLYKKHRKRKAETTDLGREYRLIDFVSDVKIGHRLIDIWAGEMATRDGKDYPLIMAEYHHPKNEWICVFRSIQSGWKPGQRHIAIQRVLAHEFAHAMDIKRLTRLGRRGPTASKNRKERRKYVCHPAEFDAEIASIVQVAVPYMLKQKGAAKMVEALMTPGIPAFANKENFRAFWPIMFNGYVGGWTRDKRILRRFIKILLTAIWRNRNLVKDWRSVRDTDCRIIRTWLQTRCSQTSGEGRRSGQNCRRRRSCASSPRSGSASDASGAGSTGNISSLPLGRPSASAA